MSDQSQGEEPDTDLLDLPPEKQKELEDEAVRQAIADGMDPALAEKLYRTQEPTSGE